MNKNLNKFWLDIQLRFKKILIISFYPMNEKLRKYGLWIFSVPTVTAHLLVR